MSTDANDWPETSPAVMDDADEQNGGESRGVVPARRSEDRQRLEREERLRSAIRTQLTEDAPDDLVRRAELEELEGGGVSAVIEVDHVSLAFDEPVLEDVSMVARTGETIVVVGESGTGKSTLLKLILRLLIPDTGAVYIDGQDITTLSFEEALRVRQKMGMVFQGAALFDSMTVFENVAYPL